MTEREKIIQECIEYLQARPNRQAVATLKGMLKKEQEPKYVKPSKEHPWRKP